MALDFSNIKAITIPEGSVKQISVGGVVIWSEPVAKVLTSITLSGQTTSLARGSTFSFGGTVTAHYSDSTTADVTSSTTFSGYNMSTSGTYTVTASYTEDDVTKTATYSLTVTPKWTTLWTGTKDIYHLNNSSSTWSKSGAGNICTANAASNRFRITFSTTYTSNVNFAESTKSTGVWWGGKNATRTTSFGSSPHDVTAPSATDDILYTCAGWSGTYINVNPKIQITRNSSNQIGVTLNSPSGYSTGTFKFGLKITKIEQYY